MHSPSATCVTAAPSGAVPARSFTEEDAAHLREVLRRCPASTFPVACQFRRTGDPRCLPEIVLGIVERFVESELRPKLKHPTDNLRLGEDLGLDSLTMMEIVILTEDVLKITIRNDELRPLRTLGDVRQFIEAKLGEKSGAEHHPT